MKRRLLIIIILIVLIVAFLSSQTDLFTKITGYSVDIDLFNNTEVRLTTSPRQVTIITRIEEKIGLDPSIIIIIAIVIIAIIILFIIKKRKLSLIKGRRKNKGIKRMGI